MWISILVISIIGTFAHFLYDWSNHNKIVGLFAAVNESTWEHIKIALTPTIPINYKKGYSNCRYRYILYSNYFISIYI